MTLGVVVEYAPEGSGFTDFHERVTRATVAQRLAVLMGFDYAGEYDCSARYAGKVYFVPSETLVGLREAAELGIKDEHDLFGGVVAHSCAATKAITHPRIDPTASAPEGWSDAFADQVKGAVLPGLTAFTPAQALEAGQRLLDPGPIRLKPVRATGGRCQRLIRDVPELRAAIASIDPRELERNGVVLEENLTAVTTYSIGQVVVADLVASYYGTQRLTTNNQGEEVYGGSALLAVRGDFEALAQLGLPDNIRLAIKQARTYDKATHLLSGMFASRRNYDIAQGRNASGQWRSGVLEQSWRIGGATGAEIAALEAFRADLELQVVRSSTVEVYGETGAPPPQAAVYFRGVDERIGSLTKYTLIEPHGDS